MHLYLLVSFLLLIQCLLSALNMIWGCQGPCKHAIGAVLPSPGESSLSAGPLSFIEAHRAAAVTEDQFLYFHQVVGNLEDWFELCLYIWQWQCTPKVMISAWWIADRLVKYFGFFFQSAGVFFGVCLAAWDSWVVSNTLYRVSCLPFLMGKISCVF